jgi:hypothetical protein
MPPYTSKCSGDISSTTIQTILGRFCCASPKEKKKDIPIRKSKSFFIAKVALGGISKDKILSE